MPTNTASDQCCSEQNIDEGKEKNLELVLYKYLEGSNSQSTQSEAAEKTTHTNTCSVVAGMLVSGSA
jgi:hypothetical protein